jgi:hypothetical protein
MKSLIHVINRYILIYTGLYLRLVIRGKNESASLAYISKVSKEVFFTRFTVWIKIRFS